MRCAWCRRPLEDVHGHGACLNGRCPMFGLNQAECCSGETAEDGWVATSDVAAAAGGGAVPRDPGAAGPAGPADAEGRSPGGDAPSGEKPAKDRRDSGEPGASGSH